MGSLFASIVNTVATMTITGYNLDVYYGDASVNNVDIANLPCRVINAVGFTSQMQKINTFGAGHVITTEWTLTDLTLWRKAGTGYGLKDVNQDLTNYLAAYHNAVRQLIAPQWSLTRCQLRSSVLEWPAASGSYHDAITATLSITEIIE